MKQLNVGIIALGFSVLFGRNSCAPQSQGFEQPNSSKYVLSEQSSGRVGKIEVSSSSASSSSTSSNANLGISTVQPQQQQRFQQPQLNPFALAQQVQQVAPNQLQRLQLANTYQQAQSQYERELAQYRQLLQAYQQQTAAVQPQIQPRVYQQPQLAAQQPVQQQQYYQPVQQQPYYQPYTPYRQSNYYNSMSFATTRPTSSSSSLFDGIASGLRSFTNGLSQGFGVLG